MLEAGTARGGRGGGFAAVGSVGRGGGFAAVGSVGRGGGGLVETSACGAAGASEGVSEPDLSVMGLASRMAYSNKRRSSALG